jgi:DNA polymerase-4
MAAVTARRRCPELVFVPPRFDVSQQIHFMSLDEAYLDVTAPLIDRRSATAIPRKSARRSISKPASPPPQGVAYNKFLAKLASDHRKPNGLFVITPKWGSLSVENLPIGKFHGVGPATAARMNALGIYTGLDFHRQTRPFLAGHFDKAGDYYYGVAPGHDDRPVEADRMRKSVRPSTSTQSLGQRATGPRPAPRQGLGSVWSWRACRADSDRQGQIRRFPTDRVQPVIPGAGRLPGGA